MSIELTEKQQKALNVQTENPPRVIDPRKQRGLLSGAGTGLRSRPGIVGRGAAARYAGYRSAQRGWQNARDSMIQCVGGLSATKRGSHSDCGGKKFTN